MSDRMQVPADERGTVRLFTVDLDAPRIAALRAADDEDESPGLRDTLQTALGASALDPDHVELFDVGDLSGLGLSGYLTEGLGVAEADVMRDRTRLDALRGHVLVVLSRAFEGEAQTLRTRAPLRWMGTWQEERPPVSFDPLPDESARGEATPARRKPVSDAAMSGRIAMLVLVFLFALTGLLIWIAS